MDAIEQMKLDRANLRRRAEERFAETWDASALPPGTREMQRCLREIGLQRIELEIQTGALGQAKGESETLLRQYMELYDAAPIGYLTLDAGGAISRANTHAAGLLGVARDDLLGRRLGDYVSKSDAPQFAAFLARLFATTECQSCELAFETASTVPMSVRLDAVACEGKKECRVTMVDITERGQTNAQRLRLASFSEENPNPVLEFSREGALLYANTAARAETRRLGLGDPHALLPSDYAEIVHRADEAGSESAYCEVEGGGRFFGGTMHIGREQDSLRLFLADITERRRAEIALQNERAWLRTVIDNVPDIIYAKDRDGRFLLANRAIAQHMGVPTPSELLGHTDAEYFGPELASKYRVDELGVMNTGQALLNADELTVDAQGRPLWLATTKIALRGDKGEIIGIVGIGRDVTERKRADDRNHMLEERSRQAAKTEVIGRLAAGVAHDFNNLLTPILGYSEALAEGLSPEDPRSEDLQSIHQAGLRARHLTRQLLAFARKQLLDVRAVDLRTVVTDFAALLRRTLREDIRLELRIPSALGAVRCDALQIEQVLMNLVVNAQDAMPDGGELTVELAEVTLGEEEANGLLGAVPGRYVLLTVEDTGQGMDASTREHLFEPFFTTKAPGKGTGLGLATVYGIVEQHGGRIRVDSTLGKGTRFGIYLPCTEEAVQVTESTSAIDGAIPRGAERVLLVEDYGALREVARRTLERQGYHVIAADGAQRALELVDAGIGDIDLLVTDVIMPGMSGPNLHKILAATRPGLKVLYISGYTDDMSGDQAVLTNGTPFLGKPFTGRVLALKVREVLDS